MDKDMDSDMEVRRLLCQVIGRPGNVMVLDLLHNCVGASNGPEDS